MTTIKYGMDTLLEALEPGVCSLVMSRFREKLEEKMEKAVKEVFEEVSAELPKEIEANIVSILQPGDYTTNINVVVDFTQGGKANV